jgi:hypothetical protein
VGVCVAVVFEWWCGSVLQTRVLAVGDQPMSFFGSMVAYCARG